MPDMRRFRIPLIFFIFIPCISYASCTGFGCSCSVSTSAVNFGTYNPMSSTNLTTSNTAAVSVACSVVVAGIISYVIALSPGNSGTFASSRYLNKGGVHMNYNLYTTSALTSIWGNGTSSTATVSDSYTIFGSTTRNYAAYGSIPALQRTVTVGTYTDSVTVTVTY